MFREAHQQRLLGLIDPSDGLELFFKYVNELPSLGKAARSISIGRVHDAYDMVVATKDQLRTVRDLIDRFSGYLCLIGLGRAPEPRPAVAAAFLMGLSAVVPVRWDRAPVGYRRAVTKRTSSRRRHNSLRSHLRGRIVNRTFDTMGAWVVPT